MKFHISSNNLVSQCKAQPGNCPLQGTHFLTREEATLETQRRNLTLGSPLPASEASYFPEPTFTEQALLWASYDLTEASEQQIREYVSSFEGGVKSLLKNAPLLNGDMTNKGYVRANTLFNRTEEDFPLTTFTSHTPEGPNLNVSLLEDEIINIPNNYIKFKIEEHNGALKTLTSLEPVTGVVYRVSKGKFAQHPVTKQFRYTLPLVFLQDGTGTKYISEVRPLIYQFNHLPLAETPPVVHYIS